MSALTDRIDTLNDRANCLFGYVLLGKATEADIAEFERSSTALQDALAGEELVSIDLEALEAWEQSQENPPY